MTKTFSGTVESVFSFKRSITMIILRWSILLFLIIKVPNVWCLGFEKCLPFGLCGKWLKIETFKEPSEDKKYNPLYLIGKYGSYKLAIPQALETGNEEKIKVEVHITINQKLIYACSETQEGDLREENSIKVSSKSEVVNEVCSNKIKPTMRSLDERCGNNLVSPVGEFRLYEIGFRVFIKYRSIMDWLRYFTKREETERDTWHTLYRVCHNTKTRVTLYTIHTLHWKSVDVSTAKFDGTFRDIKHIKSKDRTEVQETIDTKSVQMNEIFKKENVKALFQKVLKQDAKRYFKDNNSDYLARGHLVPDADMTFIPLKNATYLYTNVAPMWQFLNNGIWKAIENNIRKLAKESKQNLTIYTGVYEISSYPMKQIYLGGVGTNIMPVPLFLWKVVHNEKKNQAIAFVVINNPYEGSEIRCPEHQSDVCGKKNGWPETTCEADKLGREKILCCYEVEKLRETIPYVPMIKNAGVLRNSTEL